MTQSLREAAQGYSATPQCRATRPPISKMSAPERGAAVCQTAAAVAPMECKSATKVW
jgi:hypothetical protein